MKKIILILIILCFTGSAFAAQLCFNLTAANDARATKQATRKGITSSEYARRSLLNVMEYNTRDQYENVTFENMSTICAIPGMDCD